MPCEASPAAKGPRAKIAHPAEIHQRGDRQRADNAGQDHEHGGVRRDVERVDRLQRAQHRGTFMRRTQARQKSTASSAKS
jgi:hypothetical protein